MVFHTEFVVKSAHKPFDSKLRCAVSASQRDCDFSAERWDGDNMPALVLNHLIEERANCLGSSMSELNDVIWQKIDLNTQKCDVRFTLMTFWISFGWPSRNEIALKIPALLTKMSTLPNSLSTSILSCWIASKSETSTLNAFVLTPNFLAISSAVACASLKFRSTMARLHLSFAKRKEIALPRPFAPPVNNDFAWRAPST